MSVIGVLRRVVRDDRCLTRQVCGTLIPHAPHGLPATVRALVITMVESDLLARPPVLRVRLAGRSLPTRPSAGIAAVRVATVTPPVDPERCGALAAFSLSDLQAAIEAVTLDTMASFSSGSSDRQFQPRVPLIPLYWYPSTPPLDLAPPEQSRPGA